MTASRMLFVAPAVEDPPRAEEFRGTMGFSFNDRFTDENAACTVVGDAACVMRPTHPTFSGFTTRAIADTTSTTSVTEGLFALSCESHEAVDAMAWGVARDVALHVEDMPSRTAVPAHEPHRGECAELL